MREEPLLNRRGFFSLFLRWSSARGTSKFRRALDIFMWVMRCYFADVAAAFVRRAVILFFLFLLLPALGEIEDCEGCCCCRFRGVAANLFFNQFCLTLFDFTNLWLIYAIDFFLNSDSANFFFFCIYTRAFSSRCGFSLDCHLFVLLL